MIIDGDKACKSILRFILDKGVGGGLDGEGEEVVGVVSCEMKFYTIPCVHLYTLPHHASTHAQPNHIPNLTPPNQGALVLHDTAATH